MSYSNEMALNKIIDLVRKGYYVDFRPDVREGDVQVRLYKDGYNCAHIFSLEDGMYCRTPLEDRVSYILCMAEEAFNYYMRQKEEKSND